MPPQVVELLDRGLRVQAIKELRACERISLGEALARVQAVYGTRIDDPVQSEPSELVLGIAGVLDHPSIYMGGPSQRSIRLAGEVVGYLRRNGVDI